LQKMSRKKPLPEEKRKKIGQARRFQCMHAFQKEEEANEMTHVSESACIDQ